MKLDVESNTTPITPGAIAPKAFSYASGGGGGGGGGGVNFVIGAAAKGNEYLVPAGSVGTMVLTTVPVSYPNGLLNALVYLQQGGFSNMPPAPVYGWEWHREDHYDIAYVLRLDGDELSRIHLFNDSQNAVTFNGFENGLAPGLHNVTVERVVNGYVRFFTNRNADPEPVPPQPAAFNEPIALNQGNGQVVLFVYPQLP